MNKTYKFELPQNKEVESTKVRIEDGKVFVDVEFKEKFEPKDGDFLTNKCGKVFIYNGLRGEYLQYGAYCGTTIEDVIEVYKGRGVCNWTDKEGCRFATLEEKAAFLARLEKEYNTRWNAEKKCLEGVFNPKDGDFLFSRDGVFICKIGSKDEHLYAYAGIEKGKIRVDTDGVIWSLRNITRFATKDEISSFLEKLKKECGKTWNAETKQLEDIRWRAKEREQYYYIHFCEVKYDTDLRGFFSDERYKEGNYFKTSEAAQKVADQIKEIFKNSKAE